MRLGSGAGSSIALTRTLSCSLAIALIAACGDDDGGGTDGGGRADAAANTDAGALVDAGADAAADAAAGAPDAAGLDAAAADAGAPATFAGIDVLLVVDDSGSMAEEQAELAGTLHGFLDEIAAAEGALPSLHVGVVSTDLGAGDFAITNCMESDGGLLQSSGCLSFGDVYLRDETTAGGGHVTNYGGSLAAALACMTTLGTSGCGFEQPLESMRRALDGSNPENAGFLRDDALLVVLIVSDEDDCSASDVELFDPALTDVVGPLSSFRCFEWGVACDQPPREVGAHTGCHAIGSAYMPAVDDYVGFLTALKGPGRVVAAALTGDTEPVSVSIDVAGNPSLDQSCVLEGFTAASPAIRTQAFVAAFDATGDSESICSDDWSVPLAAVAARVAEVYVEE